MKRIHGLIGLVFLLTASGCGVVEISSPIKEGQPVRIDPCAILTKADTEKLLGGVSTGPELSIYVGPDPGTPDCIYRLAVGPAFGDLVAMSLRPETQTALGGIRDDAEWTPIGKNARYVTGKSGVVVDVLSKEGVQYELRAAAGSKQPEELLDEIKALAPELSRRIDRRLKDRFEPPKPTAPDIDLCALLPMPKVEPLVGTPPEEGPVEDRYETFGGHGGGSWSCEIYTRPTPEDCACNGTFVTLSKSNMTVEELKALQGQAEVLRGVGAHAYYVSRDLSVCSCPAHKSNPSWIRAVTRDGRSIEVGTRHHIPGPKLVQIRPEDEKRITIELTKIVLANLP